MSSLLNVGMSQEEFWRFQDETGLTYEKIKKMTSKELTEKIDDYKKSKPKSLNG